MWSHTLRELVLPVNYRVTAVRGSTSYPLPCPLASSQQSNRPSYSGARLPLSRPRHPPWRRNLGRRGWTDRAAISCASGAGPRRLSVLLFLLPFRSEALGSASFSSASSSDYSSDGVLGSCSGFFLFVLMLAALKKSQLLQNNDLLMFRSKFAGDEEAFDAPKALHKMNKEGNKPELLGYCIEGLKAIVQLSFNGKILSGESQDNSRRVHLKSRDNVQDSPKFEKILSPRRLAGAETSKVSLTAYERDKVVLGINHNSSGS
ncbi:hypothetical protein MUK42_19442 [Musa troglodytarum]|uniref:Uncharacterized protein n=1 Tax=Musa troglodytarum TaxID=320322 RepID=A0A9E7G530_9LILI|nr:hypothetical protein MUK42_19442 [Musa troglodytarum]URE06409.1 hypothetical protein MUK42_19442 [Musa troglodytarum]